MRIARQDDWVFLFKTSLGSVELPGMLLNVSGENSLSNEI